MSKSSGPKRDAKTALRGDGNSDRAPPATVDLCPKQERRIKVISVGDARVGKSCLIKRYCENRFQQKYVPTIGVDYGVKPVQIDQTETTVRVNFWDLAGPAHYRGLRTEFYEHAQGAMLVYDVADRASFDALPAWLKEAADHGATPNIALALVANKTDGGRRDVSEAEGRAYAKARGASYHEVSAASGAGVSEMFESLFRAVCESSARRRRQ